MISTGSIDLSPDAYVGGEIYWTSDIKGQSLIMGNGLTKGTPTTNNFSKWNFCFIDVRTAEVYLFCVEIILPKLYKNKSKADS